MMTTYEVMPQQNGAPDSLDSSEYSIIPDPSLANGDIGENGPVNGNFDLSNLHSALMSATPDLSLEELQSRIVDVVEDNVSLRDALKRNNNMMQQQLNTISAWHNHMTTSMSKQQLDFKEAEERILQLEKENLELKNKVKEVENKPKNLVDSETSMKDITTPLSDEDVDFEIVNRKDLKNKAEDNKLKEAEYKIASLMKMIEYQKEQFATLEKQYDDEALKTRCKELPGELLEFLERLADLGSCVIFENFQHKSNAEKGSDKEDFSEVLKIYQEKLNYYRISCYKIFQQLDEKFKKTKQSLIQAHTDLEEEKASHEETKKIFNQVQTNYDRVTKLLQIESKDKKEKINQKDIDDERELDTKMYLEQIDNLTTQLFDTEKKLHEQEVTVKSLTVELNTLKEESENIPILKSQVEVYEMDLNSANLARDAAQEEVNRLTKQLHSISSLALCDSCGGNLSFMDGSSRGKGKKKSDTPKRIEAKLNGELYICPVCENGFTSIQAIQNHVNDCIDKSGNL